MDPKKSFEEILKWGSGSDENRKRAIIAASRVIAILTVSTGKLSDKELRDAISGGDGQIVGWFD